MEAKFFSIFPRVEFQPLHLHRMQFSEIVNLVLIGRSRITTVVKNAGKHLARSSFYVALSIWFYYNA